ncbi:NUDIX hydrolase [Patescibacteria group bacterium]|nr:NUDIX hydrolase [Patescibacteria group bacterium]MBU4512137.1 NUDIX hydrolase [Patescibacteria group bacterium]MCG2692506.1 NUDIX hydrolase [Candidatus Parcubacteria bacterium]
MPKIIIASGPVIIENNKVLLNKHGDDDFWKFCGGKVEDYETNLAENAKREVKEEMGIEIEITDSAPIITYTKKEDGTDVLLVHCIAKRTGEIKPGSDIREWNWFPIDQLPDDCGPNIKPVVEQATKK